MEQWGNIQDVKELAIVVELVTILKSGMDLQLVVNLVVGWGTQQHITHQEVLNGANNYFQRLQ